MEIRKNLSFFSITNDAEYTEVLSEFFDETAVSYTNFPNIKSYIESNKRFTLGFVEVGLISDPKALSATRLIKLGGGDLEGVCFSGRINKGVSADELVKVLLGVDGLMPESLRIVLVDDDQDFGALIKGVFEERPKPPQTEVRVLLNGIEGLECVVNNKPDVVILDLKMPGLSGGDFYKKIRQRQIDVPIIILSAVAEAEEIRVLRKYGGPVCIEKSSSESLPENLWWRTLKIAVFGSQDLR